MSRVTNCLNLITKQLFISRDVSFHEHVFPFISSITSPQAFISFPHICPNVATPVDAIFLDPVLPSSHTSPSPCNPTQVSHQAVDHINTVIPDSIVPESVILDSSHSTSTESVTIPLVAQNPINDPPASIPSLRRSSRPSKALTYLKDYKCSTITSNELTQSTHLSSNKSGSIHPSGTKYPLSNYIDSSQLSPSYAHFC